VLGLEARQVVASHALSDEEFEASASRHLGALAVVNAAVGGGFDLSRFEFRATVDVVNSRLETHLVARRPHEVDIPGVCTVRLRKGESIRTAVRCVFERNRVAAMLAGVGLALCHWNSDAEGRYVVTLAARPVSLMYAAAATVDLTLSSWTWRFPLELFRPWRHYSPANPCRLI